MPQNSLFRADHLTVRLLALVLLTPGLYLEGQSPPTLVTLSPAASPVAGQPGTMLINLTGSNFPSGAILPTDVTVTLQPAVAGAGPTISTVATAVTTIVGTTRRVTFQIPASLSVAPNVAAAGSTLTVKITAPAGNLVQSSTTANFGAGISVGGAPAGSPGPVNVVSANTAFAQLAVDPSASAGARPVTVQVSSQAVTLPDSFVVVTGSTASIIAPEISVAAPIAYLASAAGKTSSGTTFASNMAKLTITPDASFVSVIPSIGTAGQSLTAVITAQYTNFIQGSTKIGFGAGISVGGAADGTLGSVSVTSPTSAIAQMTINPAAVAGPRTVAVATGVQQASLIGGFSVGVPAASLISVSPNTGQQGQQNLQVTITGLNTHFIQGTTTANFGAGIAVVTLTVNSATTATAVLNIDTSATAGVRTVSLTTGSEVASLVDGFSVATVSPTPVLTLATPATGEQGEQHLLVTVTGQYTHFAQGISQASFGSGITLCGLTVTSATSLTAEISIGILATPGSRTVTIQTGAEHVSLASGFTILPASKSSALTWTELNPSGAPDGFLTFYETNAYNPTTNRWVVASKAPNIEVLTNANGLGGTAQWTQLTTLPDPINGFPPVFQNTGGAGPAGYDSLNNRLIIFGGCFGHCEPVTNQVWVLNDADGSNGGQTPTWQMLAPTGGPPAARVLNTAVYDAASNSMTIFGGFDSVGSTFHTYSDVWVLSNANGLGGTPTWTQLTPTGGPPPGQYAPTAVYDPHSRSMIVFGGTLNGPGVASNAVWALSNANGQGGAPVWTNLVAEGAAGSPPARSLHSAVYDACTNQMTVFGGALASPTQGASNFYNDSWVLVNANGIGGTPAWVELNPTGGPPSARFVPSTLLDSVSGRITVFGGEDSTVLNDTWVLSGLTGVPEALLSVTPGVGQPSQSLAVNVTGLLTNFQQGTTQANFGAGVTVTSLTLNSPTSASAVLTIDSAAVVGPRKVTLTTDTHVVSLDGGFTVVAVGTPAILSVNPNTGQQGQQNLLMAITGAFSHFTQATTSASFGAGITVGTITVTDPTHLTASISIDLMAALGNRTITVTTGLETVLLPNGFTVTMPSSNLPTITTISPNSGPLGQSGPVGIVGLNTHFIQGTTQLDLGPGITVSAIVVTCPTCLTAQAAIAADAPVGPHNVTVTTGTEVATLPNGFAVQAPAPFLTSMVPAFGHQGQSVTSTITGKFTNWVQGTSTVNLGAGVAVNTVTVTNPTTLTIQLTVAPDAALGIRNLTVTTGLEIVSASNVFNVLAGQPVITQVNPNAGQQGQVNLAVSITGQFTNFVQGTTQLNFGPGITVNSVTVANATTLTANISIALSAAAGARTITTTTGIEVASLANAFTATSAGAVILSVSPNTGQQGQSGPVTITGQATHFVQGITQVNFGSGIMISNVNVTNATTLTAQIAIANSALVTARTVTVNTGTEIASLPNGFAVQTGTLFISVINPGSGQQGQSLPVVITGQFTNFAQGTTTANFGAGVTVNSVTVVDATDLTAQVSIAANATIGQRTVTVTTGTEVVSAANAFDVNPASETPVLSIVNPNTGQDGQTNLGVAITGLNTHFVQGTSQASFGGGGVTINGVTVTDSTHLSANISIAANAAAAAHNVTVTTGSEVAVLANAFTVQPATNHAPAITIAPTWSVILPSRLAVNYTVTDDGLPLGGALTVTWDTVTTPPGGTVVYQNQTGTSISVGFDTVGTYTLRITATDTQFTVSQDITVTVTGVAFPPPTVSIATPADGAEVTTAVNVIGSVDSPSLANWVLEYEGPGDVAFKTSATGTTIIANASLGTFDPSILLNGVAYIRLTATDTSGQSTTVGPLSLILTRNQKIGNFTVSFNDLSVPVAGLPIQIVRTYDSRRRGNPGTDFTYGWTLDVKAAQLTETAPLGDQWNETHPSGLAPYCIDPVKAHVLTVTLPDGTTYQFQPTITPHCQSFVPILEATFGFTPIGATPPNASLSILGNAPVTVNGTLGPVTFLDADGFSIFDPDQYILTLPDGRTLQISRKFGLQKMTDLNGNTLTVTSAGIVHSSGKSVTFTRDAAQRIIKIADPAGNSINYAYDNLTGDLTSVTDRENQTTTFSYNTDHGLLTIKDPRGVQPIRNDYDESGRLISHTDAFGKVITYTHNLNTRQEIVTDRLGNVTVNEYDTDGNVVKVTDALGGNTLRSYDSRDNVLTETNPLGKTRTYTCDANSNRLTETDPLGNVTTYTYNGRNQVLTITDALGRVTTNVYDANGNLTSTQDSVGNTTVYTYNGNGLRSSMQDALGGLTQYEYDTSGDLTKHTDPLGNITSFTYDANGNKLSETRTRTGPSGPEAVVTTYLYDLQNRLTQTTYPDGSTTKVAYNAIGKQDTTTDQLGRQTSYQYDLMGRLTQTTFPDTTTESVTYDAEGDRLTSTDRAGRITNFTYDQLRRLTKATYADGAVSSTGYNAIGQVLSVKDPRGNVTQYHYDDSGRRDQVVDALAHVTVFEYDKSGNQTAMTDANGNKTQYQYDNDNRRTRVIHPDATTDVIVFDVLGRTTSKTDQAGKTTQFKYDGLGHLMQVTDAIGQLTKYTYDEVGNHLTQTDANNHTTAFAYDKLGRRTQRTLPLGMSETYAYDLAGNLKTKTDFNARTTTYTYNALNRLKDKIPDASLGQPTVSFVYSATGHRQSMVDASGTTSYLYDLRDRLTQKAAPEGTLAYTYDLAGNLTSIRSSNIGGTSVDYAYDSLNRLATVKDNRLALGTTTYTYDNAGNLEGYAYPNGVQHSYQYNTLNRLTNLTIAGGSDTLASYAYTLGPAGNRTVVSELGGRQVNYTYDSLYRLTQETITGSADVTTNGIIGYLYDPVGNRQQRTSTLTAVPAASYVYDANDRLSTDTYDLNGNTTASGANTYAYDFESRLTSSNGAAVTILYDGDGNRVVKIASGVTTQYLVDDRNLTGYAQVLEEVSGGTVQRVYTYGLNRISQSQASGTSFYGYDGHGNVRMLTDATGAVTDRYDYDAFGNVVSQTGSTPNVYQYSGEQLDPNLGSYYLRARYLSQSTGRFQTADPLLDLPFTLEAQDAYEYASSDPTDRSDPSGLYSLADATSVIAIMPVLALPSLIGTRGVTSVLEKALGTEEAPIHAFHYLNFSKLTDVVSVFGLIPVTQTNDCVPLVGKDSCAFFTPTPFFGAADAKNQLQLPSLPDHVISLNLFKQKDQVSNTRNASGHPEWGSGGGLEFATPYGVFLYEPNRNPIFSTIH